ncbi:MAG TPA: hypothetical protein VIL35_02170 [Vicinamibacterales bacterium]
MSTPGEPESVYLPARDRLGATAPLTFVREFPVLGIPLRVRSNARRAIDLAALSFAAWDSLDPALIDRHCPVEMHVIVHDAARAEGTLWDARAPFVFRRHGPVLVAGCGDVLLTIDLEARRYVAFVPPAALDRPEWYRWHVNGMARFAMCALDRFPVHAATWIAGGTAVMIAGPAGSGKSSLTYAAFRRGLPILAEEATHVALANGRRLWGHTEQITIGEGASALFPELPPARRVPGGKVKHVVPLDAAASPLTHDAPVIVGVLSGRRDGAPRLTPLPESEAQDVLTAEPEEGFDQFPELQGSVARAFAGVRMFRLDVGRDPDAAVGLLVQAAAEQAGAPRTPAGVARTEASPGSGSKGNVSST